MKTKNTVLIIALAGVLAACGSSSSQGTTAPSGGEHISGGSTGGGTASTSLTGFYNVLGTGWKLPKPITLGNTDLNQLTIEGKTIELLPSSHTNSGFYTGDGNIISGTKYQFTRFGGIADNKILGLSAYASVLFFQGYATKTLPTTMGNVAYVGEAVGQGTLSSNFYTGDIKLTVNFHDKTVKGNISNWAAPAGHMKTIEFDATIKGNQFSQGDTPKNVTKGQFYGPNAEELGGYVSKDYITATFGAKKQ